MTESRSSGMFRQFQEALDIYAQRLNHLWDLQHTGTPDAAYMADSAEAVGDARITLEGMFSRAVPASAWHAHDAMRDERDAMRLRMEAMADRHARLNQVLRTVIPTLSQEQAAALALALLDMERP